MHNILILLIFLIPSISFANNIDGEIRFQFFNDRIYDATDKKSEIRDHRVKIELDLNYNITKNLSINSTTILEEVDNELNQARSDLSHDGGKHVMFDDEGVFMDKILLEYKNDNFLSYIGKSIVNFGSGWNVRDSIWFENSITTRYSFSEKLIFGNSINYGDRKSFGNYKLEAGIFKNDDKFFERRVITKIDKQSGQDSSLIGGKSGILSSYFVALDIKYDFDNEEKLSYHFGYINLGVNERQSKISPLKTDDEKGFVANLEYDKRLSKNYKFNGFVEYVNFRNSDGNTERDQEISTASVIFNIYRNYRLIFSGSRQKISEINQIGIRKSIYEISTGYKFDDSSKLKGFAIFLGAKEDRIDKKISISEDRSFGICVKYIFPI